MQCVPKDAVICDSISFITLGTLFYIQYPSISSQPNSVLSSPWISALLLLGILSFPLASSSSFSSRASTTKETLKLCNLPLDSDCIFVSNPVPLSLAQPAPRTSSGRSTTACTSSLLLFFCLPRLPQRTLCYWRSCPYAASQARSSSYLKKISFSWQDPARASGTVSAARHERTYARTHEQLYYYL